jgi:transcriptional regulator with XRE-family HTH domain
MAISFGMSPPRQRRPKNEEEEAERGQNVPRSWGAAMEKAALSIGLSLTALAEKAGLEYVTVWRVARGKGAVKTARRLRLWLTENGAPVPPVMFDADDRLVEWVTLGTELCLLQPKMYDDLVTKVRDVVAASKTVEKGLVVLSEPLKKTE